MTRAVQFIMAARSSFMESREPVGTYPLTELACALAMAAIVMIALAMAGANGAVV